MRTTGSWVIALLLMGALLPASTPAHAGEASDSCAPLAPPSGPTVSVSTEPELQAAVRNATDGQTILIADGRYDLTNTLNIRDVSDLTIRSVSGNRDAVVLRGRGMANTNYGSVPHVMAVYDANHVTIADLTLADAYFHTIQIHGEADADDVVLHNLHIVDAGEQLVKVSTAGAPGPYADRGVVQCSLIEYTDRARSWYTNGVDVLAGSDWIVRDNTFRNIRAPEGQLAGPAVLFWRNSLDTIVERNLLIECDRGIALGLSSPDSNSRDGETTYDHQGGVIRNNMIYREGNGDIGITVNHARNVTITHNTVIQNGTFPWGAIEYRFAATTATISHNLTDGPLWQRDGAGATTANNVTSAEAGWFVDAAAGDLHLAPFAWSAIDQAPNSETADDFDGHVRPVGDARDVGADEYGSGAGPSGFIDVPAGHLFDTEITWLAAQGITNGCDPVGPRFCPNDSVNRAQMATFLDRALDLPETSIDYFTDDDGRFHEAAINRLAAAGISNGCGPSAFCPDEAVSRAQMASFLARALGLPPAPHSFVDVSGVHSGSIGAIAAEGITKGCDLSGKLFCPWTSVSRAQMAAFLYRALAA